MTDPPQIKTPTIASRAFSGGLTILSGRLLVKAVDLIVLISLARLLSPSAFGLVGIAMTFVVIAETVLEFQLIQVLIREKTVTKPMLDTVFTLSILRGLCLTAVLCCASYPISLLYHEPRLTVLICVLAFAPAFRGSQSPAMVIYVKKMDFRWEMILGLMAKFVGGSVCIAVAWFTNSYWSIAINTLLVPFTLNLVTYVIAPYKPAFSVAEWRRFASFTGWVTISQWSKAIYWQLDKLVLGHLLPNSTFGKYSLAKDFSNTSQQAIAPTITKPLLSAISEAHHDSRDLGRIYQKACKAILLVVGPVFLTMGMLSEQIVLIVLGEGWSDSAYVLCGLSFVAIIASLSNPVEQFSIVLSANKQFTAHMVSCALVRVPAVLICGVMFSFQGVIFALVFTELLTLTILGRLGCRLVKIQPFDLIRQCATAVFCLVVMATCLYHLAPSVEPDSDRVRLIWGTVCASIGSLLAYVGLVVATWHFQGEPPGLEQTIKTKLSDFIKRRIGAGSPT